MRAAILTIGTEILFGQIVNTNTVFLTRELNAMGFDVLYHHTVGDNAGRLESIIEETLKDCDLIVATGGLGPTEDDLTKETVAAAFGDELVVHAESLAALEAYAKRRGWKMTDNNYKQARMPSRAVVFDNDAGTAPGFALEHDGKIIICMPGPPREMTRMWERCAKPYLEEFEDAVIRYKILRTFDVGESKLETMLLPLIDGQTDPTLATYAKEGECSLRIASKRKTEEEALAAIEEMVAKVREIVGVKIYSEDDEDMNLAVGRRLLEKGISISCCESCTGGMFASELLNVPGMSSLFDRGLVTYSKRAKVEELGVDPDLIEEHTAESPEVALAMVRGLAAKTGSRICVSSTGVAGPEPLGNKPAGTIYVGISADGVEKVKEIKTGRPDRNWNRHYTCLWMFRLILNALEEME